MTRKIGAIAERLGTTVRTLRFYEMQRLVHPRRTPGGTRVYDEEDEQRFAALLALARLALGDMGTPAEDPHNLRSKVASYFVDAARGWAYASGFTRADANNRLNVRIWDDYRQTALSESDVRRLADKISGVIYCGNDVLQPESLTEYRRLLPAARHDVLNGCAHFPWEESPQTYYAVLDHLLEER